MSRYADIEPIIKKIKYSMEIGEIRGRIWFEMVLKDLEEQPTIDVVPVVRCRNCKYAHMTNDGYCKWCDKMSELGLEDDDIYLPGNWFCADGEKMTE